MEFNLFPYLCAGGESSSDEEMSPIPCSGDAFGPTVYFNNKQDGGGSVSFNSMNASLEGALSTLSMSSESVIGSRERRRPQDARGGPRTEPKARKKAAAEWTNPDTDFVMVEERGRGTAVSPSPILPKKIN